MKYLKRLMRDAEARKRGIRNDSMQTSLFEAVSKELSAKNKNIQWVSDIMYDAERGTMFAVYEKRMTDKTGKDIYPASRPMYRRDFAIVAESGKITFLGGESVVSRKTSYE